MSGFNQYTGTYELLASQASRWARHNASDLRPAELLRRAGIEVLGECGGGTLLIRGAHVQEIWQALTGGCVAQNPWRMDNHATREWKYSATFLGLLTVPKMKAIALNKHFVAAGLIERGRVVNMSRGPDGRRVLTPEGEQFGAFVDSVHGTVCHWNLEVLEHTGLAWPKPKVTEAE